MITRNRFKLARHKTNIQFIKDWAVSYMDLMDLEHASEFPLAKNVLSKYRNVPRVLSIRWCSFVAAYHMAKIDPTIFNTSSMQRARLSQHIANWVITRVVPQGDVYGNLQAAIWHINGKF